MPVLSTQKMAACTHAGPHRPVRPLVLIYNSMAQACRLRRSCTYLNIGTLSNVGGTKVVPKMFECVQDLHDLNCMCQDIESTGRFSWREGFQTSTIIKDVNNMGCLYKIVCLGSRLCSIYSFAWNSNQYSDSQGTLYLHFFVFVEHCGFSLSNKLFKSFTKCESN